MMTNCFETPSPSQNAIQVAEVAAFCLFFSTKIFYLFFGQFYLIFVLFCSFIFAVSKCGERLIEELLCVFPQQKLCVRFLYIFFPFGRFIRTRPLLKFVSIHFNDCNVLLSFVSSFYSRTHLSASTALSSVHCIFNPIQSTK